MMYHMITLDSVLIRYSDKAGRLDSAHTLSFRQAIKPRIHKSYIIFLPWSASHSLLLLLYGVETEGASDMEVLCILDWHTDFFPHQVKAGS